MKKEMVALISAVMLSMVGTAGAHKTKSEGAKMVWKTEVSSFRGIKLGDPMPGSMPECPKTHDLASVEQYVPSYERPEAERGSPCYETTGLPNSFKINNLPGIEGAGYEVDVDLIDGRIAAITNWIRSEDADKLYAAMVQKYGHPSDLRNETFINGYGQKFVGKNAQWIGPKVTLTFEQYVEGFKDQGIILMGSKKYFDRTMKNYNQGVQNAKNKF